MMYGDGGMGSGIKREASKQEDLSVELDLLRRQGPNVFATAAQYKVVPGVFPTPVGPGTAIIRRSWLMPLQCDMSLERPATPGVPRTVAV
jgi:hypothetical protein